MKRITVIMPDKVFDKVMALAKSDKRSKSAMVVILIEVGLRMEDLKNDMKKEIVSGNGND